MKIKLHKVNKNEMLFLLAIINFIGFAYGVYYYSGQLVEWNPLYWIIIIDCPLQAFLVGILFIINQNNIINPNSIIRENKGDKISDKDEKNRYEWIKINEKNNNHFIEFLTKFAAVGSVKYGLWTVIIILLYSQYFLSGDSFQEYSVLLIAHFGLILEGILLAGIYKMKTVDLLLISFFYLFNDYSDYFIGTHPLIPDENLNLVLLITVFLSLLSIFFVKYAGDKEKRLMTFEMKKFAN